MGVHCGEGIFQTSLAGTVENSQVIWAVLLAFSPFPLVLFISTNLSNWLDEQGGAGQRTRRPIIGPVLEHAVWAPLWLVISSGARAIYSVVRQKSSCSSWQRHFHLRTHIGILAILPLIGGIVDWEHCKAPFASGNSNVKIPFQCQPGVGDVGTVLCCSRSYHTRILRKAVSRLITFSPSSFSSQVDKMRVLSNQWPLGTVCS